MISQTSPMMHFSNGGTPKLNIVVYIALVVRFYRTKKPFVM